MFPQVLLDTPRWLNWFKTADDRKIPICSHTGRAAFKRDADKSREFYWSTFEAACRRDSRHLGWDIAEPFVGVDLDDVRDKHSGAISQRGKELLAALPETYTELSPSLTGLHLIYVCDEHGRLPSSAEGDSIEVYSRNRYFAMSGLAYQRRPRPVKLITRKDALEFFHLAKPADADDQAQLLEHEPGPYTLEALAEHLAAWKKFITGFDYQPLCDNFLVPCPGNLEWGWPDGSKHSQSGPMFSPDSAVTIVNGWPCFHCFHAHCQGKTWKHLQDFYDLGRLFHRFEDWLERRVIALQGGEFKCPIL